MVEDQSEAFSFWGATKKPSKGPEASKKDKIKAGDEIAIADKAKLPEATIAKDTTTSSTASKAMKTSPITKKPVGGKIAARLKAFEAPKEVVAPPAVPPPPVPAPPKEKEDKKKSKIALKKEKELEREREVAAEKASPLKKSSKSKGLPGAFPTDAEDDTIDNLDMAADKKGGKKGKSSSKDKDAAKEKSKDKEVLKGVTPEDPSPETKSGKKERPRVVREGSSWGAWGAAPRKDEKKSKDRKSDDSSPSKDEKKSKEADLKRSKSTRKDTEEKTSSRDSSSEKEKNERPPLSRGLSSMFGPATPLARSKSTSERRPSMSRRSSSRRQSVTGGADLTSPPPDMPAKAAKMFGVTPGKLSRSMPERKSKSRGMYTW